MTTKLAHQIINSSEYGAVLTELRKSFLLGDLTYLKYKARVLELANDIEYTNEIN